MTFNEDDANDPNTFYCANCREWFPLKSRKYFHRIKEVENHECKII